MAGKPIKIEFVAEVAQYLRDTKKLEVSTEDIAAALVSASNESEDLERKLSRAMKSAEKDVGTLERAIKDLPKATDQAADKAVKDFDRIGDEAREAGQEAGQEFRQNLGESLASGDLQDVISDTLGGLVGSLKGPLGLAAGAVAAVGLLAFNKLKEDWERTVEAMKGLAQGLVDYQIEVGRLLLANSEKQAIFQEMIREDPDTWTEIRKQAEELGLTLEDVGNALLGGEDATAALKKKLQETVAEGTTLETKAGGVGHALTPAAEAALGLMKSLGIAGDEIGKSQDAYWNAQSALGIMASDAAKLEARLKLARSYAAGIGGSGSLSASPFRQQAI